jgi:hypothetical protein
MRQHDALFTAMAEAMRKIYRKGERDVEVEVEVEVEVPEGVLWFKNSWEVGRDGWEMQRGRLRWVYLRH